MCVEICVRFLKTSYRNKNLLSSEVVGSRKTVEGDSEDEVRDGRGVVKGLD